MSTQLIDFESGSPTTGDSGERGDSASTKPLIAGEGVRAAVFDRPLENLRARTEELRKKVEELLYRADADKWIITGGNELGAVVTPFPTVTWNATSGIFTLSADIVIQPFMAPNEDKYGEQAYSFGTGAVTFTFTANQFDYELANHLRIIWEEAPAGDIPNGVCNATLEGSPPHILRIVIRDASTAPAYTQASDVNTALGLILPADAVDYVMTGTGTTYVTLAEVTDTDVVVQGTYSRELHFLSAVGLGLYFAVPNALTLDGDGIGIWFEELVDSDPLTTGGRRQATPDTGPTPPNTTITLNQLFRFSDEPHKIPGAIPLCRRIGTYLVFIDGTVVAHNQTIAFGFADSDLLARYVAHINGSADQHAASAITSSAYSWIASTNVGAVITEIVDDLAEVGAGVSGASRIGNEGITTGSAHSETALALPLHTQIDTLAGWVGSRAHKTAGEKITGCWHHPNSGVIQEYGNDVSVKTRMDGSRSGGAAGPNVSITDIEMGFIRRATTDYPFMWGNPRSPCNRGSIGSGVIRKQIVLNVQRDTTALPEAGMYSRVIISGGLGSSNVYVQDVYAIYTAPGVTGTIDLATHLPSGAGESWDIVSLCSIGSGSFGVLFRDTTPGNDTYRVHAFTMSHTSGGGYAVVPRTGMPAQGVALTGSGAGIGPLNNSNIVSDGTYLVTVNGWNRENGTNVLSRITLSNGTPLEGSISYVSANCYTTGGLTIISSAIPLVAYTTYDTVTTVPELKICSLASLEEYITPLTLGSTATDICADICHDGSMIYAPILSGTVVTYCIESSEDSTLTAGVIVTGKLRYCCFDGRNLWLTEFIATTVNRTNLIGVDVGRIRSGDPATTMEFAGARKYFMLRADEECSAEEYMGRIMYDGGSILLGLDMASGQTLTGKYARLSCATDR
jgi:hypothetical protein